jgi:hypothetical protein
MVPGVLTWSSKLLEGNAVPFLEIPVALVFPDPIVQESMQGTSFQL